MIRPQSLAVVFSVTRIAFPPDAGRRFPRTTDALRSAFPVCRDERIGAAKRFNPLTATTTGVTHPVRS